MKKPKASSNNSWDKLLSDAHNQLQESRSDCLLIQASQLLESRTIEEILRLEAAFESILEQNPKQSLDEKLSELCKVIEAVLNETHPTGFTEFEQGKEFEYCAVISSALVKKSKLLMTLAVENPSLDYHSQVSALLDHADVYIGLALHENAEFLFPGRRDDVSKLCTLHIQNQILYFMKMMSHFREVVTNETLSPEINLHLDGFDESPEVIEAFIRLFSLIERNVKSEVGRHAGKHSRKRLQEAWARTIQLYEEGKPWPTSRQAALKISVEIAMMDCPKPTEDRNFQTVYDWIRDHVEGKDDVNGLV